MAVLSDRRFRRLLAGQASASFAVSALYLALGVWAKDLTHSNALAGTVMLAIGIPTLFAPLSGHVVDRVRRRPLIIITCLAIGVVVLSLLLVHGRSQLWVIYLVAAATGLATDFIGASRSALLKDMLDPSDLAGANATLQTVSQGLQLLSPIAGAGLYAVLGGHGLAIADSALFGLAALLMCLVKVTESEPEPHDGQKLLSGMLAGARHIRSVPVLFQLTLVSAAAFGVVGLFESVGFAVVDQGLHRPTTFYGVLTSVQGGGAIIGGLTSLLVLRRLGEARSVGLGLVMIALGALGLTSHTLAVTLVGQFVLGLGVPWFVVGWSTGLQLYTPPRLQGRVSATANMLLVGPQTASVGLGAWLIGIVDYRILLVVIFVGMTGAALIPLLRPAATPEPVARAVEPPVAEPVTTE